MMTKLIFVLIFLLSMLLIGNSCSKEDTLEEPVLKPTADFTSNRTSIFYRDTLEFIDKSGNTPTEWKWKFGDGKTSTEQNPLHIYDTTGVFSVTLIASNNSGTDSINYTDLVKVSYDQPEARFESSHTSIYIDYIVQFSDSSTNVPTSWEWDFGDGNTSTDKDPTHQYTTEGIYSVSLKVTNETGLDSQIRTNLITVNIPPNSVSDIDGNTYNVVQIGNQIWMKENLKATHLPDGTAIPLETTYDFWVHLFNNPYAKAYCYPNNNENGEAETYGALYTWHAALNQNNLEYSDSITQIQGVCPDGWHIPSRFECYELVRYLGGREVAGGKIKEVGNTHWNAPNTGATNSSGFTALPAGEIYNGNFLMQEVAAYFLTSGAFTFNLYNDDAKISYSGSDDSPASVRCVID